MWKWLKGQWEQIRGNAKWDFLKYLTALPPWGKIVAIVIAFCLSLLSYLKGLPLPMWAFLFLGVLCLVAIFSLSKKEKIRVAPTVLEIEKKNPDLKLIPHGDNDTSVYLEVLNEGETANVDARLRIIGLSTGRGFKTRPFDGQWKSDLTTIDFYNQQLESCVGNVRIETNKSRLLTIASIASMMGLDEQEMAIVGIDDESIVWTSDPRQGQELPYFVIQITLIAKGFPKTVKAIYKVGPKTIRGPFQMTELSS